MIEGSVSVCRLTIIFHRVAPARPGRYTGKEIDRQGGHGQSRESSQGGKTCRGDSSASHSVITTDLSYQKKKLCKSLKTANSHNLKREYRSEKSDTESLEADSLSIRRKVESPLFVCSVNFSSRAQSEPRLGIFDLMWSPASKLLVVCLEVERARETIVTPVVTLPSL